MKNLLKIALITSAVCFSSVVSAADSVRVSVSVFCMKADTAAKLAYAVGNGNNPSNEQLRKNSCANASGNIIATIDTRKLASSVITPLAVFIIAEFKDSNGKVAYGIFPANYEFYDKNDKNVESEKPQRSVIKPRYL